MKKTVFIAALAVVAMASCTKNELKVPSNGTDAVISFQPVVANATKAGYITKDSISAAPNSFSFAVFAWYPQGGGEMTASTEKGTQYMDNVKVTYKTFNDTNDAGSGTWAPGTPYYWPKNGKLSFDAYAPADAHADENPGAGKGTFTSDIKTGLQIANYTVAGLRSQYDLLYSTRALNKNTSNGGNSGNVTYDGVDIAFNHALAAIEVKAVTAANYGDDVIQLTGVTIQNAYEKGSFSQGMSSPVANSNPAWTGHNNEVDYVLFSGTQSLTTTAVSSPTISNAIVLPQSFTHDSKKVSIKVDYQIKHGTSSYLPQTQTFDLSATKVTGADPGADPVEQSEWEMGKKYTYTLVFTLEDIHFAPEVAEWTNVNVNQIDVK